MAINKVNYNGRTLIDLTEDTVTSETLLEGQTAHDRSGQAITGSLSMDVATTQEVEDYFDMAEEDKHLKKSGIANNLTTTEAGKVLDARQGKALADKLDATQSGLAIIVDGDTASMAVPVSGYAYIKNNTHGLAEGLYTNTSSSAFPTSGGTADGTVFTAVSGGGLNAIQQSMANKVYAIDGTLPNSTGDYIIEGVLPAGVFVIHGSFLTSYDQWRPLTVGQRDNSVGSIDAIIQGATTTNANRPYKIFYTYV